MARLSLLITCLVVAGCRDPAPSPYVRLSGVAPVIEKLPPAPAHLVAFWATWCPPCREETAALTGLAHDPPEGLRVVIVSEDESMAVVRAFLGGEPDPKLHLRLDEGERALKAFGVAELPTTFLVVEGRLVARFIGPRPWDDRGMRRQLGRLLSEARRAP